MQTRHFEMELQSPKADLLTFGILIRDYTRDEYIVDSSYQLNGCTWIITIAVAIVSIHLIKPML